MELEMKTGTEETVTEEAATITVEMKMPKTEIAETETTTGIGKRKRGITLMLRSKKTAEDPIVRKERKKDRNRRTTAAINSRAHALINRETTGTNPVATTPTDRRTNRKTMKSLLKNSLFLLGSACLMVACNDSIVYHSYQPIPTEGWGKSDTLLFNVPLSDSLTNLHLYAEVRNRSDYDYQNLYLFISQNLEDSTSWKTDTLEFVLANKDGKWNGTGWGSLFQSAIPIGSAITRHAGTFTFKVVHGMKDGKLTGINDIGIRIEK